MKKHLLLFIVLTIGVGLHAQKIWQANLEPVKNSGYYNIEIGQQLIGGSKKQLRDLRVMTSSGSEDTEVPYFLQSVSPIKEISSLEAYKLQQNTVRDSLNIIVVDNKNKEALSQFYVVIGNADVNIKGSIKGSEDLKNWYIVKQESSVPCHRRDSKSDALLMLDFPRGDYKYYEITLSSNQNSPLNVKTVGRMESSNIYGHFAKLKQIGDIKVDNKEKETIITFPELNTSVVADKVELHINNKAGYLRSAYIKDTIDYQRRNFELSSKGDNVFFIEGFRLNPGGCIVIENHNNPSLDIDSVNLFGLKRYACAYLEEGKSYYLKVGDKVDVNPNYDIEHFKNDIASDIPTIGTVGLIVKDKLAERTVERELLWIERSGFLWGVIILVGIFLTVVCIRIVTKLKEKEE